MSSRYTVRPCAQIAFALGENETLAAYPQCADYFNGNAPNLPVIVTADFSSDNSMELSAALGIPFGAAGWLALLLHTLAIETYVSMIVGHSKWNRHSFVLYSFVSHPKNQIACAKFLTNVSSRKACPGRAMQDWYPKGSETQSHSNLLSDIKSYFTR